MSILCVFMRLFFYSLYFSLVFCFLLLLWVSCSKSTSCHQLFRPQLLLLLPTLPFFYWMRMAFQLFSDTVLQSTDCKFWFYAIARLCDMCVWMRVGESVVFCWHFFNRKKNCGKLSIPAIKWYCMRIHSTFLWHAVSSCGNLYFCRYRTTWLW